jgi:protease-4
MIAYAKTLTKTSLKVMVIFWSLILAFFSFLIVVGILASLGDTSADENFTYEYQTGNKDSASKILTIPVNGVILGDELDLGEFGSWLDTPGLVYGYQIKTALHRAAEDKDIKAVVLEVNSPGGTIYGSQAIADGIKDYRQKTNQPVVGFVSGLAASGGYWAIVHTDHIVADYGTSTGSIGVITGPFKFYDQVVGEDGGLLGGGVMTEAGIQTNYITAGQFKDLGNPFRKMTETELQALQKTVNNEYDNFVKLVAEQRSMSQDHIRSDIKALMYDPRSAQELGLIDQTGNRDTTYQLTADRAQLKGDEYQIVRLTDDSSFVSEVLGAFHRAPQPHAQSWCAPLSAQILVATNNWADWCP